MVSDSRRRPAASALADKFRGVKPPRFPTIFEALVNAFACQQLSLEAGLSLLNRLATTCSPSWHPGCRGYPFPAPDAVARLPPERVPRRLDSVVRRSARFLASPMRSRRQELISNRSPEKTMM